MINEQQQQQQQQQQRRRTTALMQYRSCQCQTLIGKVEYTKYEDQEEEDRGQTELCIRCLHYIYNCSNPFYTHYYSVQQHVEHKQVMYARRHTCVVNTYHNTDCQQKMESHDTKINNTCKQNRATYCSNVRNIPVWVI